MKEEQLDLELCGLTHDVAMGYLDDTIFAKINDKLSFKEIESLIGQWDEQGGIYRGVLVIPDYAVFMNKDVSDEQNFYFSEIQNWTTVHNQYNVNAVEESLKQIEEYTQIKSSKEQLIQSLRNTPYYPQKPDSRYIIVFIKSELALMGSVTLNTPTYEADKVAFAQVNFLTLAQTVTDVLFPGNPGFNFLAGLLYDGETILVDNTEYEGTPIAFDMWIYDTQAEKNVFVGDFMGPSSFSDRLGIPADEADGFVARANALKSRCL
ncbi:MAG: hypothetical protein KAI17_24845 [Thiotrichaceae bacterium]|nr:hypothetical protein [Thiotrichaceae bacterium]